VVVGSVKARKEYFESWKAIWKNNMYRYPVRLALAAGAVGIATIYGKLLLLLYVCLIRK
jgi:hypothetical protein